MTAYKNPSTTEHNYKNKMLNMIKTGKIKCDVGLSMYDIFHDDWCDVYTGGFCNCNPDIVISRYKGDKTE
ncbi:MAG: hypothetical protein WC449_04780 [Candidatus Paceibacterota bacterium]